MDRKSNFAHPFFCLIVMAIPVSFLFASISLAENITLGWDANPESDLEGYIIYRNPGSPGPPFGYSNDLPEDDLANPLHPRVTLTGLQESTEYFIAVTAYDTDGNESYFSNQICVRIVDSFIENCTASASTGGGGGSGGWVIAKCRGRFKKILYNYLFK